MVVALCLSMSCSVFFQDSVRSSGVYCSTSRFWYASDFLLSIGLVAALASASNQTEAGEFIPSGVLALSGLYGIYKRGNCVRYRETATPEQWAHDSEEQNRKDEAQQRAMQNAIQQLHDSQPSGDSTPPPTYSTSSSSSTSSGTPTTTVTSSPGSSGQPDWAVKRQACQAECQRRYDAASQTCAQRWGGSDDASIKARAQCQSSEATGPFTQCAHGC